MYCYVSKTSGLLYNYIREQHAMGVCLRIVLVLMSVFRC